MRAVANRATAGGAQGRAMPGTGMSLAAARAAGVPAGYLKHMEAAGHLKIG